eukprot:TRINITY_DN16231_c0_g1_i2.p1 TRINITY_DN16231_c0_g1~~TRINITY_DN16231_c0_g1_i2.p1  ORF type:complete len:734 (-),score=121.09 TRINITY_DN16231_c0_g1_i2:232-2433(-)
MAQLIPRNLILLIACHLLSPISALTGYQTIASTNTKGPQEDQHCQTEPPAGERDCCPQGDQMDQCIAPCQTKCDADKFCFGFVTHPWGGTIKYFSLPECEDKKEKFNYYTKDTFNPCSGGELLDASGNTCVASCSAGYHGDSGKCVVNECTSCANGQGGSGADCPTHGGNICTSCDADYHLNHGICELKQCTACTDGVPASGADCPSHGGSKCASCNAGYHLVNGACQLDQCTACVNGQGASGTDCPTHGGSKCASCNAGYHLVNGACQLDQCTACVNGQGATGADCPSHGGSKCSSCDAGYHLVSGACQLNQCASCDNGEAASGPECPTHGGSGCGSCEDGYHLVNGACELNQCTSCLNGQGASGSDCSTHGGSKCETCNDGYYLEDDSCHEKTCSCPGGTGALGANCPEHEDTKCTSCKAPNVLLNELCYYQGTSPGCPDASGTTLAGPRREGSSYIRVNGAQDLVSNQVIEIGEYGEKHLITEVSAATSQIRIDPPMKKDFRMCAVIRATGFGPVAGAEVDKDMDEVPEIFAEHEIKVGDGIVIDGDEYKVVEIIEKEKKDESERRLFSFASHYERLRIQPPLRHKIKYFTQLVVGHLKFDEKLAKFYKRCLNYNVALDAAVVSKKAKHNLDVCRNWKLNHRYKEWQYKQAAKWYGQKWSKDFLQGTPWLQTSVAATAGLFMLLLLPLGGIVAVMRWHRMRSQESLTREVVTRPLSEDAPLVADEDLCEE